MALHDYPTMSIEDYLLLDRNSRTVRYEYLDGRVYMLAGGSVNHSLIAANLTGILYGLLRGSQCAVYNSDARVQLSETRYFYPDVLISCDPRERGENVRFPRVVIEVLSPSTEAFDRGSKFAAYRGCSTVEYYVLVDSQKQAIEVYHREGDAWVLHTFGPGDVVVLNSLKISFSVSSVYEKTSVE